MRYDADGRCARALFHQVLSRCHFVHLVRCGSDFSVSLGFCFPFASLVWLRGDDPVHRNPSGRLFLSLEERCARLESPSRTPGPDFVTELSDLEQNPIIAKIRGWRPEAVAGLNLFRGEITVVIYREHLRPLAKFLLSEPDLAFTYLSDVTGVDRFPIEPRFELNYHLLSISRRESLRFRVRMPGEAPVIEIVVPA